MTDPINDTDHLPCQPQSFYYGNERIVFERRVRSKSSSGVLIKVHPDGRVIVSASKDVDDTAVLSAVKKRSRWIYSQLNDFRQQLEHVTQRQYISGESHLYLGKRYLLKVMESPNHAQHVKLLRGQLVVTIHRKEPTQIQALLVDWYKARAKVVFATRMDALLPQTQWVSERPSMHMLTMQTQWGSCSPNGRITLNPLLVKAPRECIDYVILHELCHIAEHNHSDRFYRLMSQVMPHWEGVKSRLDEMAGAIFAA